MVSIYNSSNQDSESSIFNTSIELTDLGDFFFFLGSSASLILIFWKTEKFFPKA